MRAKDFEWGIIGMLAGALMALAAAPGTAHASIVGGNILGGDFIELDPTDVGTVGNKVGDNNHQSPNLYAFYEGKFTLDKDIDLDVGKLVAGSSVHSHYVFFDPADKARGTGFVDFATDIVGLASSLGALSATDIFGHPLVEYLSPYFRGLEYRDTVTLSGGERLFVDFFANKPGDYIRVFTAVETPLPGAAWLFIAGLSGFAFSSRQRKAEAV